ncbi:MAG: hypothetical protein JWN76_717 [Chitinophagaceae bacterium]|nr:hypothetical protein [Chitinophagaceae bacterium]
MATEPGLNELLARIEVLSQNIEQNQQELILLKEEVLALLKGDQPVIIRREPVVKKSVTKNNLPGLENFIGLKLIHFAGIIVLIIGLTIGVKYAIDINLISPAMRIGLTYLAGALLFFTALLLRRKYELFSMILFSGSMASAYFTTYAAFEYYALLSRTTAFVLMLLFTFFTVYTSLKYNKQQIAILGLVGAYGIPFFVKGNVDNVAMLFAYIFIINCGILVISFKKYWLSLTYLSFFTTWSIYLAWLIMKEDNSNFNAGLLFAILYFILFLVNCLGFKILKKETISLSDTVIVVLDTVLFYMALILLYHVDNTPVVQDITLAFGISYLIAAIVFRKFLQGQQHFYSSLFSIAFTALSLYVAVKYSGLKVTITWVVMAVLIFITGMFYKVKLFRIAAIVLFGCTLFKLVLIDSDHFSSVEKIIAYIFTGTVLLVVSFLYQKFKKTIFGENE